VRARNPYMTRSTADCDDLKPLAQSEMSVSVTGWVDGRTGRLGTVIIRPCNPNAAATGCFSSIVREAFKVGDPLARELHMGSLSLAPCQDLE
jgi:hypothetical protein